MPITVTEIFGSRTRQEALRNPTVELLYLIQGTNDDAAAVNAFKNALPATYAGRILLDYSVQQLSHTHWTGRARYGTTQLSSQKTGDSLYNFDTGGGSIHVTQSPVENAIVTAYGANAPDFKKAIGVNGKSVEGVDIPVPNFTFSETHYIASAIVTDAYKQAVRDITASINDATFQGHPVGTVKFEGAQGSKRGDEDWEINFRFSQSPLTNFNIGGITGVKGGWDYLWVYYREEEDNNAKEPVPRPRAVYVHQMFPQTDFNTLGIGV